MAELRYKMRVDILRWAKTAGSFTAAQLADAIDIPPWAVYRHIRRLRARSELIVDEPQGFGTPMRLKIGKQGHRALKWYEEGKI